MEEIERSSTENIPKWRFYNVVILGVSFMLMFTAFQTSSMIEQTVLEGERNQTNGSFTGNGYTSLAVIYVVFAATNWLAPSVVAIFGAKISMIIGGICYTLFIASFLKPMNWSLYLGSVVVGIGAAVIWTGQGNFLTLNSDSNTIGRNSGIFWALLQCSLLFGNLYIYFQFNGEIIIQNDTRMQVYIVLTALCAAGTLLLLVLRTKRSIVYNGELNLNTSAGNTNSGPFDALITKLYMLREYEPTTRGKRSLRLFATKEMMLLSVCFAYTGLELTFFSGVYGTCVGHTQHFGNKAKSLQGLTGILIGVGEIIGGALFGLLGKRTNKYGRDPVVFFGFVVHTICFYLIFINLPAESPIQETKSTTFLDSKEYIVLICAFMLGLGDSSYNTQIYSLLGYVYPNNSAPAFALYKFIQSVAAAIGFFYSDHLILTWQLLILVLFNALGALTFFIVERSTKPLPQEKEGYTTVSQVQEEDE